MARDARTVLNMKRKQQQQYNMQQQRFPNNNQVRDARQLLRLKKLQGIQKGKPVRQSFSPKQNRLAFNRPFVQNFVQQGTNRSGIKNDFTRNTIRNRLLNRNNFLKKNLNKTIQVAKGGSLKITSLAQNLQQSSPVPQNNSRFVSNLSGLTVTTRARPTLNQMLVEVDNGDELERMTLQDLPEIDRMRDIPQSMLLQNSAAPVRWELPGSSKSSTLFGRLAKSMENTMIADSVPTPSVSLPCWKVIVTNLQSSVTDEDITELFGHVGHMKSAEIVQPGMAIVEYYSKEDAVRAHSMYHNRLLDGFPMQCVIQSESGRATVASRLGEKYEPAATRVQLPQPISASTFSHPSTSRRVAFTVQLP